MKKNTRQRNESSNILTYNIKENDLSHQKKKHSQVPLQVLDFESGAYENRTHDLLTASQTL